MTEGRTIILTVLAAVLAGHIGAALKHHLVNKDNVLRRMVKGE